MSGQLNQWRRGDAITAIVIEILDIHEAILRFGGGADEPESQIMRVANQTNRQMKVGDEIKMRVIEINPLKFQYILDSDEQRRRGRIDVSI